MDPQDKEWLARYRDGDVNALGELVARYQRPLFGFILKMTEGRDEADEIFQEVWIRVIRHLSHFKDGALLSWLFRIAHNVIIDRGRKKKPDMSLQDTRDDERTLQDSIAGSARAPSREAGDQDMRRRIDEAVERLPEEQRAVFWMRMEGDLPFKEIATIQQTSINTVLARMQYALQKLRVELADEYALLPRMES